MEKQQIKEFAQQITYASSTVTFKNGLSVVGFFQTTSKSAELEKENKWTFIENINTVSYREAYDEKFSSTLNGDDIMKIVHPAL